MFSNFAMPPYHRRNDEVVMFLKAEQYESANMSQIHLTVFQLVYFLSQFVKFCF